MCDRFCDTLAKISKYPYEPASLLLSNTKPLLPLPFPERNHPTAQIAGSREYLQSGRSEVIVENVWLKIFGEENDNLPHRVTIDNPFFDLGGDLLAAAQVAVAFQKQASKCFRKKSLITGV